MTKSDEFMHLDAMAQAQLVRSREVRPIELVEAAIKRIEVLNPSINAVITPMFEQARTAATRSLPKGPLTGVPFVLKDLLAAHAGVRMCNGSRFLADFVPDHDSELVSRLKRAGLVVVGKTNTPELGLCSTTEPLLFGPTHNPWDLTRTTGGSSGGSAAAVASGMVPMGHANDAGGSIRIPSSCCGVFGLKPTRGRNPLDPDMGDFPGGLCVEHAITRSVRDSAALLDATSCSEMGDPYRVTPPERPFVREVGAAPGRLRIAFTDAAANGAPVHADCVKAVRDAARLCEELGHQVEEAAPTIESSVVEPALGVIFSVYCASTIQRFAVITGREPEPAHFEPATWMMYEMGKACTAVDYGNALTTIQKAARKIAEFFTRYAVWLTPTVAEPPVPLGAFTSQTDPWDGLIRAGMFAPFTGMANFTGQPAMSVPLFWNSQGLPIGTQFVGRFGDEATLFRLASQLEQARPWARHWPPAAA
jgi:amidase